MKPLMKPLMKALLLKTGALLGSCLIRNWMATLDSKAAMEDAAVDAAFPSDGRKRIYIFWHENLLWPLYYRKNCNIAMLLSQHRDAHVLEQVARIFGFACVRGSSNRGGRAAIRELMTASAAMHLTITPDGPQGPRRKLASGPIYLSSKLQMPLVLLGIGFDRPWRLNSWDKFALPRPFSRTRIVVSGDIQVPPDLDRDTLEQYRVMVEERLTFLSDEGERWAMSGESVSGESVLQPGPKASMFHYAKPKNAELHLPSFLDDYVQPGLYPTACENSS